MSRSCLNESPLSLPAPTGAHCESYKDPCANVSCLHGGTCDSEGLNGTCVCAPGFTGKWTACYTDHKIPAVAAAKNPGTLHTHVISERK